MKKLKIVVGEDNPILRAKSQEIKNFDQGLKKFVKAMKAAMIKAKGLGIAAPQVGENIRVFLTTLGYDTEQERLVAMVNPKITYFSEEKVVAEEGCLSLPGTYGKVERSREIEVEFSDLEGSKQVLRLRDLDARVVQHELDHLDGVLFIDKLYGEEMVGDGRELEMDEG